MELEQAKAMLLTAVKDRLAWGANASLRVSSSELMDAIVAIKPLLEGTMVPREELTLSNRRLAAANAQLGGYKKRANGESDGT